MNKQQILNGMSEEEFYRLYPTKAHWERANKMKLGGLSGAPHNGQPTADQFFDYGSHMNDKVNVPMSNPYYLQDGGNSSVPYNRSVIPLKTGRDSASFREGYMEMLPRVTRNQFGQVAYPSGMLKSGEEMMQDIADHSKKLALEEAKDPNLNRLASENAGRSAAYYNSRTDFDKKLHISNNEVEDIANDILGLSFIKNRHGYKYHTLSPPDKKRVESYINYIEKQNKAYGGTPYYGGPIRPYAYGGDVSQYCWGGGLPGGPNEMPEMLHGGYHSPMNYGSYPVTSEYGGILDPSNANDFPIMEDGGSNLSKIIKAASKSIKKSYASGGDTTIQGGNQNYLETRKTNFDTFIKNNIYNSMIKKEESDMMDAFQAKRGKQKEPDVPIDYTKALPDIFPTGRDYSKYIPANIQSQYFMSNADYARMKDLKDRMASGAFNLTGFEGTPEWGPMARLMGKTGRKIFGPKSVTYTYTGKPITKTEVADTKLNLPAFEKNKASKETSPYSFIDNYNEPERTEYEDRAMSAKKPTETFNMIPRSRIKEEPGLKESSFLRDILLKKRNPNTGDLYQNFDEYDYNEYQDQARADENIQLDPVMRNNMENLLNNLNKIKQGYGSKKYGGGLGMYQMAGQTTGQLTQEQYDNLINMYKAAETAAQTNPNNPETLAFQKAFHSYGPTKQIAEGLLQQRQATNDPTSLGKKLGKTDKSQMYGLGSNEDSYFGKTTKQYLAEIEKLKPQSTPTIQATPGNVTSYKPNLTNEDVTDPGLNLNFKAPQQKPNTLSTSASLTDMNVPDPGVNINKNPVSLPSATTPKPSKEDILNKAKGMDMKPLKSYKPDLTGPYDVKEGPEEKITSKIKRKTSGIGKAIGQYAPAAANFVAGILEGKPKLDPMQNYPVTLGNRGDYDINTGDFRPHLKVPVKYPGGPGAYRMEDGGLIKALSGLEIKMQPGLYGTNGNRQFTLPNQVNSQKFAQQPTEVRGSLTAVPRDEANLEAEGGETAMVNIDGIPAHFDIKGPRHSQGGVPLNLPDNSFIFSDTASMRIKDPNIQKEFGMSYKKSGYTPAQIAKKFDINKYRKVLSDPHSEELDRKTAESMIANHNMKLAKLGLIQESMKGFPQGIPVVAMPYLITNQIDPAMYLPQGQAEGEEQPDAEMGVSRYGGNIIAQYPTMQTGGTNADTWDEEFKNIKARAEANAAAKERAGKLRIQSGRDAMFLTVKGDIERKRDQALKAFTDHYKYMLEEKRLGNDDRYLNQAHYVNYAKEAITKYDELLKKMNTPGKVLLAEDFETAGIKSVNTKDVHGYVVPGGTPKNFKNDPQFSAMIKQGMGVVDPYTFKPVKYPMMPTPIPGGVQEAAAIAQEEPAVEEAVTEAPIKDIEIKKKPVTKKTKETTNWENVDWSQYKNK